MKRCFFPFSTTGKNVSFLAASASRAAIHNVLSLKGNLADVTAKAGAQTILACMIGENELERTNRLLTRISVYTRYDVTTPLCMSFFTY